MHDYTDSLRQKFRFGHLFFNSSLSLNEAQTSAYHEIAIKNASCTFSDDNNNKKKAAETTATTKPRTLQFWKKERIAKNQKVTAGFHLVVSATKYELSERF